MKMLAALPLAIATAACATPATPTPDPAQQSALAEALSGRTAGAPVTCVRQRDLESNRSAGDGAILFEGRGGRLYVNRPAGGCPALGLGRTLITRSPSGQLCRGDIVQVADLVSGVDYGSCSLGEFQPYSRRAR